MTGTGVLPDHALRALIAAGAIAADPAVTDAQVQPASLDLRLGTVAYRVRASFLAGSGRTVADRIAEFEMHRVDLTQGAVLEKGCVYVVPLMERLALPQGITAVANAKSSTGRLDLLTRTITDGGTQLVVSTEDVYEPKILSLIGIPPIRVTGHGQARLVRVIDGSEH